MMHSFEHCYVDLVEVHQGDTLITMTMSIVVKVVMIEGQCKDLSAA